MTIITKYIKKHNDIFISKNKYNKKLVIGIEKVKEKDDWRNLGFKVSKYCKSKKIKELKVTELDLNSKEFIEGLELGNYSFSMKKKNKNKNVNFIYVRKEKVDEKEFSKFIKNIKDIIESQTITKDLVNTPANIANSDFILKEVNNIFKNTEVNITIYNEIDLRRLNMFGHLSVNRASKNEARTIKLEYIPKEYKEHDVYIGKGLTYDSGGLSIKPTNSMKGMQSDKSGAMVLLGFMRYIAIVKQKKRITAYLAIAENMISSESYRPGDILIMKNGLSVNIKNTDAEGRLVLFDNLCLAQEENKDLTRIISIATLTGAAVYQFGEESGAVVSFNKKLKKEFIKKGAKAGENFMDAQFNKYMMNGVDDTIADLSNTGTPNMGCQKAGLFLSKAITKKNKKKFIHLDIAGPSWIEKEFDSNTIGGTGFGVRTLINI